jgi:AcrR family transcriptional regulator
MRKVRSEAMYRAIWQAFLTWGYEDLTMGELAKHCGVTRRALYHHFSNKEEAFRAQFTWRSNQAIDAAIAAASRVLCEGGSAVDAICGALDARYGLIQRDLALSAEHNRWSEAVASRCADLDRETDGVFQLRLANLLGELQGRRALALRCEADASLIAELLMSAIVGVNRQSRPIPLEKLPGRYRLMCETILFGCAMETIPLAATVTAAPGTGVAAE